MNDKCKNINKKKVHGGFECNDDGKWSKNCRPFYCDFGYYYNHHLHECIRDNCTNLPENDDDNKSSTWKIILIVVGIVVLIVAIVFLIFKFIKKKNVNKENIEKMSLNL